MGLRHLPEEILALSRGGRTVGYVNGSGERGAVAESLKKDRCSEETVCVRGEGRGAVRAEKKKKLIICCVMNHISICNV